jgi:uncharacterized OB-fold protein
MIEETAYQALAPEQDADSAPFWAALAEGRLLVVRCSTCRTCSFPPMPGCPRCGSDAVAHIQVSGEGRVYSWVTIHVALHPAFADEVPYTIVAVELAEGARMLGRLLGDGTEMRADLPVEFAPYRAGEHVLPGFRPEL